MRITWYDRFIYSVIWSQAVYKYLKTRQGQDVFAYGITGVEKVAISPLRRP